MSDHSADFQKFYQQHHDGMVASLRRGGCAAAEDVVQDAFLIVWERLQQQGRQAGTADDPLSRAYVYTIARNQWLERLKREGLRVPARAHERWDRPETYEFAQGLRIDLKQLLRRVCAILSPRQVKCLIGGHSGMTGDEMARAQRITRTMVHTAVSRGRSKLSREGLESQFDHLRTGRPYAGLPLRGLTCPRTGRGLVRACGALFGSLVGVGAVPKLSAAFFSLAAVAVAGWVLARSGVLVRTPGDQQVRHSAAQQGDADSLEPYTTQPVALDRQLHTTATAAAQASLLVRGRCVDENGSNLPGVTIELVGGPLHRGKHETYVTTADGCFALQIEPEPDGIYLLLLNMPDRVGPPTRLIDATTHELGDIKMYRRVTVTGRVLDQHGQPVPGVQLVAESAERLFASDGIGTPYRKAGGQPHMVTERATSANDGSFTFPKLSAGRWSLTLESYSEMDLEGPTTLVIDHGEKTRDIVVHVSTRSETRWIAGQAIDQEGQPVNVGVKAIGSRSTSSTCHIHQGGYFRIDGEGPADDPVRLVLAEDSGFELTDPHRTYRWGQAVRLVVRKAVASLEVTVIDENGSPVVDYEVRWWEEPLNRLANSMRKAEGHHERGITLLDKLPYARGGVIVRPAREDLMPSDPVVVEPSERQCLVVRVHRAVELRVVLAGTDGAPLASGRVELLRPWVRRCDQEPPVISLDSAVAGTDMTLHGGLDPDAWLLAAATSDESGMGVLRCSPLDAALVLRARAPGYVAAIRKDIKVDTGLEQVRMTLERVATLAGVVHGRERLLALHGTTPIERPSIELHDADDATTRRGADELKSVIADDGTFVIPNVPPGSWQVWLRGYRVRDAVSEVYGPNGPIGHVQLTAGQHGRLALEVPDVAPGALTGILRMGDKPGADVLLRLAAGYRDEHGNVVQTDAEHRQSGTTADGGFTFTNLAPGVYRLSMRLHKHGSYDYALMVSDWIALGARDVLRRELDIPARPATFHVRNADGTPAVRCGLRLVVDGVVVGDVSADADGWIRLDQFPQGATLWTPGGRFGPFEAPAGNSLQRELQLVR